MVRILKTRKFLFMIINIKLKKNKNFGTNGTASTGTNIGRYQTSINSLSLNNRNKKNNFYGNYSNRFGANKDFINIHREQSNTIFDSRSRTKNTVNANNLKIGYDYYANAKNTFGIMVSGNFNNSFSNAQTRTPIMPINSAVYDSILVARNNDHHRTYNLYSNVNYKFINQFSSFTKKRIIMMTHQKNNQISRHRHLLMIPALLSVFTFFSFRTYYIPIEGKTNSTEFTDLSAFRYT